MSDRKQNVREFYENLVEEQGCAIDGFEHVMREARIGRVELVITGDWEDCDFICDSVEIEQIDPASPTTVIEAFQRHMWFSQHALAHVFAFKIPVEGQDTYAIGIAGVADDGYDNSGNFIEIFDADGVLLGSAMLGEGEKPNWLECPIDESEWYGGTLKWADREDRSQDQHKAWSEESAVRVEQEGAVTRVVIFEPE
jgi:hypothetical protein